MERKRLLEALKAQDVFDIVVIGGGATGCGIAVDAAARGLKVALVEQGDFASGTSSRSTKLVHGGVRYLEAAVRHLDRVQFNLVHDALHERGILLRIAPHLCRRIPLVTPLYHIGEVPYVYSGLRLYDALAGELGLGRTLLLGKQETLARFPMIRGEGLRAGVLYYDGQFNDARMNLALALTAIEQGAAAANYVEATALVKEEGRVVAVAVADRLSGERWVIRGRCVVNATGPFSDQVRLLDDPQAPPILSVSSGIHIVLDRSFVPPEAGITIPRTEDGRVLFILPWQGRCLVGTTDEPAEVKEHPRPEPSDVEYLLRHLRRYFTISVAPSDVTACWAGLRPLVQDPSRHDTARLARDHVINVSASGLITICGGKWTTYRKMAQDAVDRAIEQGGLTVRQGCSTDRLLLHGAHGYQPDGVRLLAERFGLDPAVCLHLGQSYGDRAEEVAAWCAAELREPVAEGFPFLKGEILYAVRSELAVTAADFLVRRLPLALLDRAGAAAAASSVVEIMAGELGWDAERVARERREVAARLEEGI